MLKYGTKEDEKEETEREKEWRVNVENRLGMEECGWYRWEIELRSLEI